MAPERVLGASLHDQLGELGREEALESAQALELRHLLLDAPLQRLVPLAELARLSLDRVVELLDPQKGAHAREQLGLIDRLGEEVVGPGLEAVDPLLGRIERRHHDHGEDAGRRVLTDPAAHFVAGHARHHHVQQHQVRRLGVNRLQRLRP